MEGRWSGACRVRMPRRRGLSGMVSRRLGSSFVVCSAQYDENTLKRLRVQELGEILKEMQMTGFSTDAKPVLIEKILSLKGQRKGENARSGVTETVDFSAIEFVDRTDLIKKLRQFTVAVLTAEVKERGVVPRRRKKDLMSQMATLLEEDSKQTDRKPKPSAEALPEKADGGTEHTVQIDVGADAEDLATIQFENKTQLIDKLRRFTMEELKVELTKRAAYLSGSKMELVMRVASLLFAEKLKESPQLQEAPTESPSTPRQCLQAIAHMNDMELRFFLDKRNITDAVDCSRYLDVRQFVFCAMFEKAVWENADCFCDKTLLLELADGSIQAVQRENETTLSLVEQCHEQKIGILDLNARDEILSKLDEKEAEWMRWIAMDNPMVQQGIVTRLRSWLEEISSGFSELSPLREIEELSDQAAEELVESTGMKPRSADVNKESLRQMKKMEIQFYPRSVSILASQMLYRVLSMPLNDLKNILDMTPMQVEELEESPTYQQAIRSAFLKAARSAVDVLYESVMSDAKAAAQRIENYRRVEEEVAENSWKEMDPSVKIGIVLGGSRSRAPEVLSSVRCLLDHLQTAPFPMESNGDTSGNGTDLGMRVVLYYIRADPQGMCFYRLTAAELLTLDASALYRSTSGIWDAGERIPDVLEFLRELKTLTCFIPLTRALDVLSSTNEEYAQELRELDRLSLGSTVAGRRLTQSRYNCLTFLRSRGYIVPPLYRLQQEDCSSLEKWKDGFDHWSRYHHLVQEGQKYHLYPSNSIEKRERLECQGVGELVAEANRVLAEGVEEVAILPTMDPERFVEFSCVVLETKDGPVALQPTEFEELPSNYVRSLSTPLRRHTPPRFSFEKVQGMRNISVSVFEELKLSGYACIHGRMMIDPEKETSLKNEAATYPRPIPEMADPLEDVPLPPEFLAHIEKLKVEMDKEIEEIIQSYDESEYTVETLAYFRRLDEEDAKHGKIANRYQKLEAIIEALRHRHDNKRKITRLKPLKRLLRDELLEESRVSDSHATPVDLATGEDYSIVITDVDSLLLFSTEGLIFQQAAVSGLSHAAVLRHLLNLTLPASRQLSILPSGTKAWNPLLLGSIDESDSRPKDTNRPKQVWILCGGEGTGHQASLASGVNAMMKLSRQNGVQPYLFVLDPGRRLSSTPEVLRGLYERRNSFLEKGVPEEVLMDECRIQYLSNPKTIEYKMPWRPVWCIHYAHCLYPTIDESLEASERLRQLVDTAETGYDTLMTAFKNNLLICQKELDQAGVEGVAGLWGGKVNELPPSPRMMTMDMFASDAASVNATIFLTVHGDIAQDGTLQDFLGSYNLPCTGCDVTTSQLCGDKKETARYLVNMDDVSCVPHCEVLLEDLKECGKETGKAEALYSRVTELLPGTAGLCIKPTKDGFGAGVARIACSRDLHIYGKALDQRWEAIYGTQLTIPHCSVAMPKPEAKAYLIEPYIRPAVPFQTEDGQIMLPAKCRYIEVSFGLVGDFGCMWVMNPSLILTNLQTDDLMEDRLIRGIRSSITPIPSDLVERWMIERAKKTVEKLADSMGLRGVARVDAFMDIRNGELQVMEVDTTPYLGEHSTILQQAVVESPPMYPDEVFQQILRVAYVAYPDIQTKMSPALPSASDDEESEDSPSVSPWEDNEFWENEGVSQQEPGEAFAEPQVALANLWGSDDEEETDNETSTLHTS